MHDDHLQGILFTKTEVLDLARKTPQERFLRKVAVIKRNVRSWNARPVKRQFPQLNKLPEDYAIPKSVTGQRRKTEITELAGRLKTSYTEA